MRWFQALMPREDRFFELYIQHAQLLVQGAQALRVVLQGGPNVDAAVKHVFALEDQADGIARNVFTLVQKFFITPFDRGDIKDLVNTLHDKGIKALFLRHKDGNAMLYVVGIEIFDHLEKVMDRFESVAHRISGLVIEQG